MYSVKSLGLKEGRSARRIRRSNVVHRLFGAQGLKLWPRESTFRHAKAQIPAEPRSGVVKSRESLRKLRIKNCNHQVSVYDGPLLLQHARKDHACSSRKNLLYESKALRRFEVAVCTRTDLAHAYAPSHFRRPQKETQLELVRGGYREGVCCIDGRMQRPLKPLKPLNGRCMERPVSLT